MILNQYLSILVLKLNSPHKNETLPRCLLSVLIFSLVLLKNDKQKLTQNISTLDKNKTQK